MAKLNFYLVDPRYIDHLKKAELAGHAWTKVPDVSYGADRKPKFLCGVVLKINDVNYYVPVTSYKKKQSENFLVYAENGQAVGSLRFNYMIPVPLEAVRIRQINDEPDVAYRKLLLQELNYCNRHAEQISNMANRTYRAVVVGKVARIAEHSCDFSLLEQACREYCTEHGIEIPKREPIRDLKELCAAAKSEAAKMNQEHTQEHGAQDKAPTVE